LRAPIAFVEERADGSLVVSSRGARNGPTDAGSDAALDADGGGDAGAGVRGIYDVRYRFWLLSASGETEETREAATPRRLAQRVAQVEAVGFVWLPTGTLFHWVETTPIALADGRVRSDAVAWLAYVAKDGSERPPQELLRCEACAVSISSSLAYDGALLAIASGDVVPLGTPLGLAGPPRRQVELRTYDRDAYELGRNTAPWAADAGAPRLRVVRGVPRASAAGVEADVGLRAEQLGALRPMPHRDALWSPEGQAVWFARAGGDAGATTSTQGDIFFSWADNAAAPLRVGTGASVRGGALEAGRLGVVTQSGERTHLALWRNVWPPSDARGRVLPSKVGGDVPLGVGRVLYDRISLRDGGAVLVSATTDRLLEREVFCGE
jgi:hypothetical protein